MFRDLTAIIGLIVVGFVMGMLIQGKSCDCLAQHLAVTPKATAPIHQYRHTPYAVAIP